jgi:hypothetical protein
MALGATAQDTRCHVDQPHVRTLLLVAERGHADDVGVEVIRTLTIISRCVIRALAASAPCDLHRSACYVWQQLAAMRMGNAASESARVLLTAWDDPELAALVAADMLGEQQQYYDRIRAWFGA